jgi:hypothetical protein
VRVVRADRFIQAPPAAVWATILDFRSYPEWNSFIVFIGGEARAGSQLTVRVRPPGRKAMTFKPVVKVAEPERELAWLGRFVVPWLLDGEHHLRIERSNGGCVFVQEEYFRGALTPLYRKGFEATKRGFEAMNDELKSRVESQASETSPA